MSGRSRKCTIVPNQVITKEDAARTIHTPADPPSHEAVLDSAAPPAISDGLVSLAPSRVVSEVGGGACDIVLHAAREVALVRGLMQLVALLGVLGDLLAVARPVASLRCVPHAPLHVDCSVVLEVYSKLPSVQDTALALAVVDNALR